MINFNNVCPSLTAYNCLGLREVSFWKHVVLRAVFQTK